MSDLTYSASPEIEEIATKLKARYYLYIGHVDIDSIQFSEKSGPKPKKGKVADISGISSAWVREYLAQFGSTKLYCLSAWSEAWEELSPAAQEWAVFRLLLAVHEANNGQIKKPDVSEFGIITEFMCSIGLGAHWEKKVGELPSLLDGVDPLPIPLPDLDTDDGSTL